jgi:glucosylglycerate synthase
MATADPISDLSRTQPPTGYALLALLPPLPQDQLESTLSRLTSFVAPEELLVAAQNGVAADAYPPLRIVEAPATRMAWTLTAADFINAAELARKHEARSILMLGPGCASLSPAALESLASAVMSGSADLALPHYDLPPHTGLVNSAILYPLTRALFATRARFPLSPDMGLSQRMADRMAAAAQRFTAIGQDDAMLWPVSEAVSAGCSLAEFDAGPRTIPQPPDPDIRNILVTVTGSLFSDIEAKAAFWQRPRRLGPARITPPPSGRSGESASDVASMVDRFRLAYSNLQEIWALVLPPHSLLGLKRLSLLEPAAFRMPENLWARIVFDFLIAFKLRTINRGHLLGALIPLYLAWVAGHFNVTASGVDPERHIEAVAAAFDADKPYLVSRWRWPDRFNP